MRHRPRHEPWTPADLPDLTGRVAVVTGANGALGLAVCRHLADAGARVLMACRDSSRAAAARTAIRRQSPHADVHHVPLDLADLARVRRAAADVTRLTGRRIDILVNNAAAGALPLTWSADGYETHFAVNHLGHFALTGLLLPSLAASGGGRVVTVSSLAHWFARPHPAPHRPPHYNRRQAYAHSKLANLHFTAELDARLRTRGIPVRAVAAHPGFTRSGIWADDLRDTGHPRGARVLDLVNTLGQHPDTGALPVVRAAVDPRLEGGQYIGPAGAFECRGRPVPARRAPLADDAHAAARLWTLSESLTGIPIP